MGKSPAEQIADIANKQVEDFDIENEDVVFQHAGGSDSENGSSEEDDEALRKEHYVSVGKSKLRQSLDQGLASKDPKYLGSKGSRAALFDDSELQEPAEGDSEYESESQSDQGSSGGAESSESEVEEDVEDEEVSKKKHFVAQLIQKESQKVVNGLAHSVQRDASKGYAILQQHRFFDKALDSRIKLQKALSASNKLPVSTESWNELLDEENSKLLSSSFKILQKVLKQCVDVRNKYQIRDHINQREAPVVSESTKKRSFQQLLEETESLDTDLKAYRSAVLNKWSTKVSASSGKSLLQSSKFKAINQSADVQVNNQLADMSRLLKRTRVNRGNVKPLMFDEDLKKGLLKELETSNTNAVTNEDEEEDEEDLDIPKNYDPRRKDNSVLDLSENPYIYDDEDFYRVLLNDLVEQKIQNSQQQGNGVTLAITSRAENKLKKNIDTKASKGRKLNYSVQEPIANFEASINTGYKWSDEQIDEFFAGLLGQKINFDEHADDEETNTSDKEEVEAIKQDDIQIFG